MAFVLFMATPCGAATTGKEDAATALPLPKAVQLALAHDLDVKLAQLTLEAARLDYRRSQATDLLDGTEASRVRAESAMQSAELAYRQQMNEAFIRLIDEALGLELAQLGVQTAQDRVDLAQRRLEQVQNRRRAGASQALDELSARAGVSSARAALAQARATLASAEEAVRLRLGLPADAPVSITDLPDFTPFTPEDRALAAAASASPTLVQRRAVVGVAEIQLAQLEVSAAAPLDLDKARMDLALARTQLEQARVDLAVTLRAAMALLEQAADRYEAAKAALDLAGQRHEIIRRQVEAGLKTDLDLLSEQISLKTSQSELLGARRAYENARLKLQSLLGATLIPGARAASP